MSYFSEEMSSPSSFSFVNKVDMRSVISVNKERNKQTLEHYYKNAKYKIQAGSAHRAVPA